MLRAAMPSTVPATVRFAEAASAPDLSGPGGRRPSCALTDLVGAGGVAARDVAGAGPVVVPTRGLDRAEVWRRRWPPDQFGWRVAAVAGHAGSKLRIQRAAVPASMVWPGAVRTHTTSTALTPPGTAAGLSYQVIASEPQIVFAPLVAARCLVQSPRSGHRQSRRRRWAVVTGEIDMTVLRC